MRLMQKPLDVEYARLDENNYMDIPEPLTHRDGNQQAISCDLDLIYH